MTKNNRIVYLEKRIASWVNPRYWGFSTRCFQDEALGGFLFFFINHVLGSPWKTTGGFGELAFFGVPKTTTCAFSAGSSLDILTFRARAKKMHAMGRLGYMFYFLFGGKSVSISIHLHEIPIVVDYQ